MATKTVTANGNAQIDTAQFKYGAASGLFDGTGDFLTITDDADFDLGTGNFTIDFWVRFNLTNPVASAFYQQRVDGNNTFSLYLLNGTSVQFSAVSGGVIQADYNATWSPSTNTWYHFAMVRNGTSLVMYVDGTALSITTNTAISTNSMPSLAANVLIANLESTYYLNGWIDDYRVTKGSARWTANFTPPTSQATYEATNILMLHMNGADASTTFTDDSANTADVVASSKKRLSLLGVS